MPNEIQIATFNVGALTNAKRPGFKLPTGLGGITVLNAQIIQSGAGTQTLNLIDLGTSGTVSSGTIATLTSAVFAANVPQAMTLSTPYVSSGRYIGVEELNVGTSATVTIVSLAYETGK